MDVDGVVGMDVVVVIMFGVVDLKVVVLGVVVIIVGAMVELSVWAVVVATLATVCRIYLAVVVISSGVVVAMVGSVRKPSAKQDRGLWDSQHSCDTYIQKYIYTGRVVNDRCV